MDCFSATGAQGIHYNVTIFLIGPTLGCLLKPLLPNAGRTKLSARKGAFGEVGWLSVVCVTKTERDQVLKPNYQFEKRQRELEKKKKKAEKTLKKESSTEASPDVSTDASPVTEAAVLPKRP